MVFPRPERLDLHADADDGIVGVRVDGKTVLELNSAPGITTTASTLQLGAGAHRLEIHYWQREDPQRLNVLWAPAGAAPEPLSPNRLFPEDPGATYWVLVASMRLPILVLLVWVAGPVALFGRMAYRTASVVTGQELRTRVLTVLFPALLGPSQILLFGPWTVHGSNRTEFLVSFWELAPRWLWLLGPTVGMLVALGIILPARWFPRYVAALFSLGVLLWVQGSLLVADYGLLDGGGLDLASHAWRAPFEIGLWVGLAALATVFATAVARAAPVASSLLVTLQATLLLLPAIALTDRSTSAGPAGEGAAAGWRLPPPEIYELSSTRNLIHIVLDMFPSHTFAEILDTDRSAFDRNWSGFTFFRDHLGAFRTTKASMPAMLTGVAYRNEMPFKDFLARPSVFHALGQHGYRLRSLTSLSSDFPLRSVPGADTAIRYYIPRPYGRQRDYLDAAAAQLLDLSLFRHAPHGVKARVYREQQWLLQQRLAERRDAAGIAERPFGDAAFLLEFARRITLGGDAPVYTFMHLITPHPPLVTDADCAYAGKRLPLTAVYYTAQARCALAAVRALLDQLRALDLYDRSAIIVTSDHGSARFRPENHPLRGIRSPARDLDWIEPEATPLLLIKPFGAQGPLHTSYAPTAITDMPATLLDLAGLPNTLGRGTSALALDPAALRERTYAHYSYGRRNIYASPYFDVLHVFSVNGPSTSPEAWRYRQTIFEPTDDHEEQRRAYQIGLSAVADRTTNRSGRRVYHTDEYAVFFVAPDARPVTFDVRRAPAGAPTQTVTVRVNGQVVGKHRLADDAWHPLAYPIDARRAENSPFCVELLVNPVWRDAEGNEYGLMVRGDL